MEQYRVLIVDDCVLVRDALAEVLRTDRRIHVAAMAGSVEQAADLLTQEAIDVVILDIEMPKTSGLEFLPTLLRLSIPAILLTNRAPESEARRPAPLPGAAGCFDKARAVRDAPLLIGLVKAAARRRLPPEGKGAKLVAQSRTTSLAATRPLSGREGSRQAVLA